MSLEPRPHRFASPRRHTDRPEHGGRHRLGDQFDLSDAQLRTYERKASRLPGGVSANLLTLLERRLDHVVFRLGLAPSVADARQLIHHGHIVVEGRRLSIPSFLVSPGQTIEVHPNSRERERIRAAVAAGPRLPLPRFLERAADGFSGRCCGAPDERAPDVDGPREAEHDHG